MQENKKFQDIPMEKYLTERLEKGLGKTLWAWGASSKVVSELGRRAFSTSLDFIEEELSESPTYSYRFQYSINVEDSMSSNEISKEKKQLRMSLSNYMEGIFKELGMPIIGRVAILTKRTHWEVCCTIRFQKTSKTVAEYLLKRNLSNSKELFL